MDDLNGKTATLGAALPPLTWSFTRPAGNTSIDYLNAAVSLKIFELDKTDSKAVPQSDTPVLTLALGTGLVKTTNTSALQEGTVLITKDQMDALLGATAKIKQFSYVWTVTPTGGAPVRGFLGDDYGGRFSITREGYFGATAIKP